MIDLSSHKNNIRVRKDELIRGGDDDEKKKIVKCKFFPKCNLPEGECPFFHPTEECTFFPKCTRGEKCLYIHPDVMRISSNEYRYNASTAIIALARTVLTNTQRERWQEAIWLFKCNRCWGCS